MSGSESVENRSCTAASNCHGSLAAGITSLSSKTRPANKRNTRLITACRADGSFHFSVDNFLRDRDRRFSSSATSVHSVTSSAHNAKLESTKGRLASPPLAAAILPGDKGGICWINCSRQPARFVCWNGDVGNSFLIDHSST